MRARPDRYTAVAIVLHWAIAIAILGNFAIGWWMHHAVDVPETRAQAVNAYQLHKSIGLTILLLSLLRLIWRLLHRPPPFPAAMPAWERLTARITHWLFYGLMIGIPLSGWLYVSTQWRGDTALNVPTLWFGLFEVPHLFGLNQLSEAQRQLISDQTGEAHELLAFSTLFLLGLHVAAALKHQFVNRDEVLGQMLPLFARRKQAGRGRRTTLWLGTALIAAAMLAAAIELSDPAGRATAMQGVISSGGNWAIDPEASEVAFSGRHAGRAFRGHFESWHAELQLDPRQPQNSSIRVSVDTASATDGVKLHDKSLPEAEWFDVANHPQAIFRVTQIKPKGGDEYAVHGLLTIKDREIELPPFTLNINGNKAHFTGSAAIDRADVDMGMESDPRGEWVSREIVIQVDALAIPLKDQ